MRFTRNYFLVFFSRVFGICCFTKNSEKTAISASETNRDQLDANWEKTFHENLTRMKFVSC